MSDLDLILSYCMKDDLSTHDPYDIWFTWIGDKLKKEYNSHKNLFLPVVAAGTIADWFFEGLLKKYVYQTREYPIVRAQAAITLLNLFKKTERQEYLSVAERHLAWLEKHMTVSKHGVGWGIPVAYPVSKEIIYPASIPFSTVTPYVAEAFLLYQELTKEKKYNKLLLDIFNFFFYDLQPVETTQDYIAYSYGPCCDRSVFNANSYTLYMLARLSSFSIQTSIEKRIAKIYNFIHLNQNRDGSWYYSTDAPFIDGFHTCFILKNLIKTQRLLDLPELKSVIEKGIHFWMDNLIHKKSNLCIRFYKKNKPSFIIWDLYDNAESLSLAKLTGRDDLAARLEQNIRKTFFHQGRIYSQVDLIGGRHYADSYRWAVMPFLRALSEDIGG